MGKCHPTLSASREVLTGLNYTRKKPGKVLFFFLSHSSPFFCFAYLETLSCELHFVLVSMAF